MMYSFQRKKKPDILSRILAIMLLISMLGLSAQIPIINARTGGEGAEGRAAVLASASEPIRITSEEGEEREIVVQNDVQVLPEEAASDVQISLFSESYTNIQTEGDFRYAEQNGKAIIIGLTESSTLTDIDIPQSIGGLPVTEIADRAFYFKTISGLRLPEGLEKIGEYAFAGAGLTQVTFPDSLRVIESAAFRDNGLSQVALNQVSEVMAEAFLSNELTSLDLGTGLTSLGDAVFKGNLLTEVTVPDTLRTVGNDVFSYNNRFVKLLSTAEPLNIPSIQKTEGGYGYVINPITLKVIYQDRETGAKLLDDAILGDDLTSLQDVFSKGNLQSYKAPTISGYTPVGADASGNISFTPTTDNFELTVEYTKAVSNLELKANPAKKPMLAVGATNVEAELRSFIIAKNAAGEDLSALVEIEPSNIDTTVEGQTHEVRYTLRDAATGEVKRLSLNVYVGLDMNNFPLGNGWVLGDFVYGGQRPPSHSSNPAEVTGLSAQGRAKALANNTELILPHINPITGDRIKIVSSYMQDYGGTVTGTPFKNMNFTSVSSYDDNIEEVGHAAFQNNSSLSRVDLPNVKKIGSYAFYGTTALQNFDFSNIEFVDTWGFHRSGIRSVVAPKLKEIRQGAFYQAQIGSDPAYPQGIDLPVLEKTGGYGFGQNKLSYLEQAQIPMLKVIGDYEFNGNHLVSVDLPEVTEIKGNAFETQNSRKLTTVNIPKAVKIGRNAFYYNSITTLNLPATENIGDSAFSYNKIESLNAPALKTVNTNGFYENQLKILELPELTQIGATAFGMNNLTEARLPKIQSIGVSAFWHNETDYNRDGVWDKNPGLKALGYFIPIYTDTQGIPSKENYIINPESSEAGAYTIDDFTWDAANPNRVTGLTTKGKAKLIANDFRLELTPNTEIVAADAFRWERIKAVSGANVGTVENSAFRKNPLEKVDFPNMTTVGEYAFAENTGDADKKFKTINLDRVNSMGIGAFQSAGLESVSIPLLTTIPAAAFYANRITTVSAPNVKKIEREAFQGNQLTRIDAASFPVLEEMQYSVFRYNPVEILDVPTLKFSYGAYEYEFTTDRAKPITWIMPDGIKNQGNNKTSYSANTFSWLNPPDAKYGYYTIQPGAIILTEAPNPDGSLRRTNADGHKEVFHNTSYNYNGRTYQVRYRKAIINPSTVKVNYRLEDGSALDGQNGRPKLADFREYIYEEQNRVLSSGAFASGKTYQAPELEGYVLVSSTDAAGVTTPQQREILLPYEAEGSRTDREITFTYKKIEKSLLGGPKLSYGITEGNNVIVAQNKTYISNSPSYSSLMPQMLTAFNIEEVKTTIRNGKLRVHFDSPYIDPSSIIVASSDNSRVWYEDNAWTAVEGGVEIDLKDNIAPFTTAKGLAISYRFKSGTPEGSKAILRMSLSDVDASGTEKIIAEAQPVEFTLQYQPAPTLTVSTPLDIPNYNYTGYTAAHNGPRTMGGVVQGAAGYQVSENPEATVYHYSISNVYYPLQSVRLKNELPTYTAINASGAEEERRAVFDPALNPGWILSDDGQSVIYTKALDGQRDVNAINKALPSLRLQYPGLKEKSPVQNKAYMDLIPKKDERDTREYPSIAAGGDLGVGDSISTYPLYVDTPPYTPGDVWVSKQSAGTPRGSYRNAYLYDHAEDRSKDIGFILSVEASNELTDYKDVSIIDYGLDARLRYKELRFHQTPAEAGNTDVLILGYRKTGSEINPSADTVVFEKSAGIDKARAVGFGNIDIDYLQIKILGTDETPLNRRHSFTVVATLRNPDTELLTAGTDIAFLENRAMFLANQFKKGSNEPAGVKPNDPKFAQLQENSVTDSAATVTVLDYKLNVRLDKSLSHPTNPAAYPRYSAADSGEVVIEGQQGAYHLTLQSFVTGNTQDRGREVLRNLEIIDVLPESISVNQSDVILNPLFIKAKGKFQIIEDYPVLENGVSVKRKVIKFTSESFDMKLYGTEPFHIASIKTKYIGNTIKSTLTNKAYASWDNPDVEVVSPAKGSGNELVKPDGTAVEAGGKKWSYDAETIRVSASSALVARLYIRNRQDMLWQESTPTGSQEPFDYKLKISNFDTTQSVTAYEGIDVVTVLPGVNDYRMNKQGLRGSEFGNTVDVSRIATDLKVPAGYTVKYYNTDDSTQSILENRTTDDLVNDGSIVWSDTPAANTKAIRITANSGVSLGRGESFEVEIPMKAPALSGFEDALIGKKAVNTAAIRHISVEDNVSMTLFSEVNSVNNYMSLPKATISLTKYGKLGVQAAESTATPLEGAGFELVNKNDTREVIAVAFSDANGLVEFKDVAADKEYIIREFSAPESYVIAKFNNYTVSKDMFKRAAADNYHIRLTEQQSKNYFMNAKPLSGSIKIIKEARDGVTLLPNVSFIVSGMDNSNRDLRYEVSTGADGSVTVPDLPEGRYKIEEVESTAVNRYQKAPDQQVTINASTQNHTLRFVNDKFQVLFQKIIVDDAAVMNPANWDQLTDFGRKRVQGYRFQVRGEDGSSFTTNATGTDGRVILQNLKTEVVYTVTELPTNQQNSSLKDLYEHNTREYKFKITHDGKLLNAANGTRFKQYSLNIPNIPKSIKGEIKVQKIDNSVPANPLAGAKLSIGKVEFAADGSVSNIVPVAEKLTQISGSEAFVVFDDLEPGTYQIRESLPPAGYNLNTKALEVTIPSKVLDSMATDAAYEKSGNSIIYKLERSIVNTPLKVKGIKGSDVEGYKNIPLADAKLYVERKKAEIPNITYRETGTNMATVYVPLENVVFELYKLENGQKSGGAIAIDGSTDILTNDKGEIQFGSYAFAFDTEYGLYEKATIPGYEKLESPKRFILQTEAQKAGFKGEYNFYLHNKKEEGSIFISKYDSLEKRALSGAVFALYKGDRATADFNSPIKTVSSGADGMVFFEKLPYGKYVVREVSAPAGYKTPTGAARDIELELTGQAPVARRIVFNTKLIDIEIKKQWSGGSESSANVRLLRSIQAESNYSPVVIPNVTDAQGNVVLNAANSWKVRFTGLDRSDDNGNKYYFKVQEQGVDSSLYTTTITGTPDTGFTVTNTATAANRLSIGVTKDWVFKNGESVPQNASVEVVLKKVISGDRLPIRSTDVTEEVARIRLSSANNWQHTFSNLVKRENGADIIYRVEEAGNPAGFVTEYRYDDTAKNFTISNKAISRDKVELEKRWIGVDPATAPEIVLELYDKENLATPLKTATPVLVGGRYVASFADVPSYAYTAQATGEISARKIQYVVKEKFADGRVHAGYSFVSDMDDAKFAVYGADANMASDISASISNTLKSHNITVRKTWTGIDPAQAPAVRMQLWDVTADSSADLSDTTSHIAVGAVFTLDQNNAWTKQMTDLPQYKPDGITPIRYVVKETDVRPGYVMSQNSTADGAGNRTIVVDNTRVSTNVRIQKSWDTVPALYAGESVVKPNVKVHLFADTTDNQSYDPTEVFPPVNGQAVSEIVLTQANGFAADFTGLPKYAGDGVTEIQYYVTEEPLTGFSGPTAPLLLTPNNTGVLTANLHNVQERLQIHVEKKWVGLEKYPAAIRQNTPTVNIDLYNATDSANPRLVDRQASLERDAADASGSTWRGSFGNLPKYDANGREIVYKVVEREAANLPGYVVSYGAPEQIDAGNRKFTVTNTVKERELSVRKTWIAKEENAIEIRLKQGTTVLETLQVTRNSGGSNDYSHTFRNLPYYDIDGRSAFAYSIEETALAGYSTDIVRTEEAIGGTQDSRLIFNITNTYHTVDIDFEKTWQGVSPAAAPEIILQLVDETDPNAVAVLANKTVTLNAGNSFKASLEDLPKFKDDGRTLIKYGVRELPDLEGYTLRYEAAFDPAATENAAFGKWTIRASNTRLMQEMTAKKTWAVDLSGYTRPEVRFTLLADASNDGVDNPVSLGTSVLNAANQWQISYTQPQYAEDGRTKIKYYIQEEALPGYHIPQNKVELVVQAGAQIPEISIENRLKTRDIFVEKTWEGLEKYTASERGGIPAITVRLLDKTDASNPLAVRTPAALVQDGNVWKAEFQDLPMYKADGVTEIVYAVEEVEAASLPGYAVEYAPAQTLAEGNLKFGIRNTVKTIPIYVEKRWEGVSAAAAPAVTLRLVTKTANKTDVDVSGKSLTLSQGNNWQGRINDMPMYHVDGRTPVIYGLEESTSLAGYSFNYTLEQRGDGGIDLRATNTRGGRAIRLKKTWTADTSAYDRPEVNFRVWANESGNDANTAVEVKTVTLNRAGGYEASFELPKFAANGTDEIYYFVSEDPVPGYRSSVNGKVPLRLENNVLQAEIGNTLLVRDVVIEKAWSGLELYQNTALSRLPNIHVELYDTTDANAPIKVRERKPLVKDTDGLYKARYEDLPKFKQDGVTPIIYSVKEVEADSLRGYAVSYATPQVLADDSLKLAITNTVETVEIKANKRWVGVAPADAPAVRLALVDSSAVKDVNVTGKELRLDESNAWAGSFGRLPKYGIDGVSEIDYSLQEMNTKRGYTFTQAKTAGLAEISLTASNSRVLQSARLQKTWAADNAAYTRPDVRFILYKSADGVHFEEVSHLADGSPIGNIILSERSNWQFNINGLAKYEADGESLISYYVGEEVPSGYKPVEKQALRLQADESLQAGLENSLITRDIYVEKSWSGLELYRSTVLDRLPNIRLALFDVTDPAAPRQVGVSRELTKDAADGLWKTKYEDMPKYKEDGQTEIVYEVREVSTLEGFPTEYLPLVPLANEDIKLPLRSTVLTTDIQVQKNWIGVDPSAAPAVELHLRDADHTGDVVLDGKQLSLHTGNSWTGSLQTLPKYHIDGASLVNYTLEEQNAGEAYRFDLEKTVSADGRSIRFIASNTRARQVLQLKKVWAGNSAVTRPSVTFFLYKKVGGNYIPLQFEQNGVQLDRVVLNGSENWEWSSDSFYKYDESGTELVEYYVKEEPVPGYVVPEGYVKLESVTGGTALYAEMRNAVATRNITVENDWLGMEIYTEAELSKLARTHAVLYDVTGGGSQVLATLELRKDTDGKYRAVFADMPKYKEDGVTEIEYAVKELEEERLIGYTLSYTGRHEDTYGNLLFTMENRPRTRNLGVHKTWEERPSFLKEIEVYLLKNGGRVGNPAVVAESNEIPWTYTFKNLPFYEADGVTQIDYSVKEVNGLGFKVTIKRSELLVDPMDSLHTDLYFEVHNAIASNAGGGGGGRAGGGSVLQRFVNEGAQSPVSPEEALPPQEGGLASSSEAGEENTGSLMLSGVPKTGDDSNIWMYVLTLLAGTAFTVFLLLAKRRSKDKKS